MKTIKYSFLFFLFCSVFTNISAQSSDAIIERKVIENMQNNLPRYSGIDAIHSFTITLDNSISDSNISYQEEKAKSLLMNNFSVTKLNIEKGDNNKGFVYITCDGSVEWEKIKQNLSSIGFEILERDVQYVIRK
jgi:hypothetical protein